MERQLVLQMITEGYENPIQLANLNMSNEIYQTL